MVAVANVMFDFGGTDGTPGTSQIIDSLGPPNLRFKDADDATIDANNPIIITAATTKYSRWKHIYLKFPTGPASQINNVKFYSDGANGLGTGRDIKVGNQTPTKNSGSSAGYEVAGTSDEELVAGHVGITTSASVFTKTAGSPLTVSISEAGSIINANNETTDYVLLQAEITDTASPGFGSQETLTFSYDEV